MWQKFNRLIVVVAAFGTLGLVPSAARASIEVIDRGVLTEPAPFRTGQMSLAAIGEPGYDPSPVPSGFEALAFEAIGDPVIGGSWWQSMHVHSHSAFTGLGMMVDGGPGLQGPVSMDFSFSGATAGWSQAFGLPGPPDPGGAWTVAGAQGVSTQDLTWNAHLAAPIDMPFTLTLFSFHSLDDSTPVGGAIATWTGGENPQWVVTGLPARADWGLFQESVASIAPIPSALLLAGIGLAAVVAIRRRLL